MTRYHCLVLRVKLVSEQQHSYTISSARAPPADVNSVKVYPSHKLTLRILLSPRQSIHHTCYSLVSLGKTCKGTSFSCGRSGSASCLRSAGQQGYCHFLYDLGGFEGMWRRWRTEAERLKVAGTSSLEFPLRSCHSVRNVLVLRNSHSA